MSRVGSKIITVPDNVKVFIENGIEVNRKVWEPEYWKNRGFIDYKDGKRNGLRKEWYTDGQIKKEGNYKNDKKMKLLSFSYFV